jgi:hypothetical protein
MPEIEATRFVPESGKVVELPAKIGRIDTYNDSSPARGVQFTIAVVGSGETEEYVLLNTPLESGEIEDGSQILAAYIGADKLWYAIPRAAYGGEE